MFILLVSEAPLGTPVERWTDCKVVGASHPEGKIWRVPFRSFAEAYDYADEHLVCAWRIAQLNLDLP